MSARKRVPCGGVPGRTHRSAPTRGGRYSEPTENWCEDRPCQRGRTEPAPYGCNRAGRSTAGCAWGVASASQIPKRNLGRQSRSPRPTEAPQVVPSEGPMYLRHGFRRPNFVPKFGASVMGIGPYAPRGDEGRHAGSSCPTGGCGEPPRLPWPAAHSGAFAARVRRNGWESRQSSPPKWPATSDNPSVSLRLTAPFTQGSLWGRGMRIAASLRSSQ